MYRKVSRLLGEAKRTNYLQDGHIGTISTSAGSTESNPLYNCFLLCIPFMKSHGKISSFPLGLVA